MKQRVSIILPTFNEVQNAPLLVNAILEQLKEQYECEILVVDDSSTDGTLSAVNKLNLPMVRTVSRNGLKPSLGASIYDGIKRCQGEYIVFMDSDFNHPPHLIPFMLQSLAYFDCLSGSRFLYGGAMDNPFRYYLSWMFNIFTRLMTGGFITDNLYGFFAFRRSVLLSLPLEEIFWGYGDYAIRLLFEMQKRKKTILQFPVVNGKRIYGTGNTRFLKVFVKYTIAVLSLVLVQKMQRRKAAL